MIVLFVKASVPASVAIVPDVGKIRFVVLVVLKVISAPEPVTPVVVKFLPVLISPPSVIVFPVLLTPVPPFAPNAIPVILVAVPIKLAVIMPALKSPFASLFTIALAVFTSVAELAKIVAALIFVAVEPPTLTTCGKAAVPPKSFVN